MSDADFDDGYQNGKRAIRKTAGWIAGLSAAVVGPVANKVIKAADAARARSELQAQQIAQRRIAFDQRTTQLQHELRQAQQQTPRWRIRHWIPIIALGALGAWLGYRTRAPDWWAVSLLLAVVGVVVGLIVVEIIRGRGVRRAIRDLNQHRASSS